jgi:hypothetical protein
MEQTYLHITIPKPCTQAWDSMESTADDKHCLACNKTVIDFSNKTDEEIKNYFTNHPGKVCGNFRQEQIDIFQKPTYTNSISIFSVIVLFLMCFTVHTQQMPLSRPGVYHAGSYILLQESDDEENAEDLMSEMVSDSVILKGRLRHGHSRDFVPNAKVTVDGTSIVAVSDSLGRFVLKIPKGTKTYIQITIEARGFEKQNARLNVLARNEQEFYVQKPEDSLIRGEVIYNPSKK